MATNFTATATSKNFTSGGSGKFRPLRKKNSSKDKNSFDPFESRYNRMAFKGSRDPVYAAFNYVEGQSLSKVTSDFIQENIKYPLNKLYSKLTNAFA
ncbi:MAG: hypothetical protein WC197_00695 [Candidatus Gastranaerophilaceae bacterium]